MITSSHATYESLMAQAGDYHGANNLQMEEMEKFYNETAEASTNLTMVAKVDKELISTLTTNNSTSTGQLVAKDIIVATLQAHICTSSTAPAPASRQVSASDKHKCYCWTHGTRVSSNHNNANYREPGDGHKRESTRDNKMGGLEREAR
jgi:hypothetical protein